jgi:hypothetical protein
MSGVWSMAVVKFGELTKEGRYIGKRMSIKGV